MKKTVGEDSSSIEPSIDEDDVEAAFVKWAEGTDMSERNRRPAFYAGVEFGLRHPALVQSATAMTDEPIQKLVDELCHPRQRNERYYEPLCARAADELERLAEELKEERQKPKLRIRQEESLPFVIEE